MSRTPDRLDKTSKHCCGVDLQGIGLEEGRKSWGYFGRPRLQGPLPERCRRFSGISIYPQFPLNVLCEGAVLWFILFFFFCWPRCTFSILYNERRCSVSGNFSPRQPWLLLQCLASHAAAELLQCCFAFE